MKLNSNKFISCLLGIFFLFIISSIVWSKGEGKVKLKIVQDPVYSLRVDTFGVKYLLMLNGAVIFKQTSSETQLTTSVPVNYWMSPDGNVFELQLYPDKKGGDFKSGARLKVDLIVEEGAKGMGSISVINFSGPESLKQGIDGLVPGKYALGEELSESPDGNLVLAGGVLTAVPGFDGAFGYQRKLAISSNLPRWRFLDSEELPDYYVMDDTAYYAALDDIFVVYDEIQKAFETGDVDKIVKMFSERSEEMDKAFYKSPGDTALSLKQSIQEDLQDANLELAKFTKEMVAITLEGDRRLVSLTREGNTPALAFKKKAGGSTSYDFKLRKDNGKWIVTR